MEPYNNGDPDPGEVIFAISIITGVLIAFTVLILGALPYMKFLT